MTDVSVIILTYNEEMHIQRCIESVKMLTNSIYVIDSYSTDDTVKIAESLGAVVLQNKWTGNQASQFNWALANLQIDTEWILRLDADEYLTTAITHEINDQLPKLKVSINGVFLERKLIFMGKLLKYGVDKIFILRIFRKNTAFYSESWMDEHLVLNYGETTVFNNFFVDDNLNTISNWTAKHNDYAIREVINILDNKIGLLNNNNDSKNVQVLKKSWYAKMPMFFRALAYFVYRYIFKLGFLDGKEGFLRHFLQGWWYRTLVDAKLLEIKRACGNDKVKIKAYFKKWYGIEI